MSLPNDFDDKHSDPLLPVQYVDNESDAELYVVVFIFTIIVFGGIFAILSYPSNGVAPVNQSSGEKSNYTMYSSDMLTQFSTWQSMDESTAPDRVILKIYKGSNGVILYPKDGVVKCVPNADKMICTTYGLVKDTVLNVYYEVKYSITSPKRSFSGECVLSGACKGHFELLNELSLFSAREWLRKNDPRGDNSVAIN